MKNIILSRSSDSNDMTLKKISNLANFSWFNHPGFFADGKLENMAFEIGANLKDDAYCDQTIVSRVRREFERETKKKNLLVATQLYDIGGHTKVIDKFIRDDVESSHLIVLTKQNKKMPEWLEENAAESKVPVICLETGSSVGRASTLRSIAKYFDRVLLFIHPHDEIPIVAFSVKMDQVVFIENHAHFWFWLGITVGDVVFSHLKYMDRIVKERRRAKNSFYFPLAYKRIAEDDNNRLSKKEAKEKIGLDPDCFLIVTIGSREKYAPNKRYNFFLTAEKILNKNPFVTIVVIGVDYQDGFVKKYVPKKNDRMKLLGPVWKPYKYYEAADIILESFPLSSIGPIYEAVVYHDVCPLFAYGEETNILTCQREVADPVIALDEEEYLNDLDKLVMDSHLRDKVTKEVKDLFIKRDMAFYDYLNKMYQDYDGIKHAPARIPKAVFEPDHNDLELAGVSRMKTFSSIFSFLDRTYLKLRLIEKLRILFFFFIRGMFWPEYFRMAINLPRKVLLLFNKT
ncbi:hypothetical protein ACFL5V_01600 [Fibrobacterota bacterium]